MHAFLGKPIDLAEVDAVLRRVSGERPVAGARSVAETPPKTEAIRLDALDQIESWAEPGFAQKLVAMYLDDAPARVQRMKDALERKDAEELAREAHALKSASATLGIQDVSEACGRAEQAARRPPTDLADLTAHVAKIAREVTEAERALTKRFGEEVLRAAKLSD